MDLRLVTPLKENHGIMERQVDPQSWSYRKLFGPIPTSKESSPLRRRPEHVKVGTQEGVNDNARGVKATIRSEIRSRKQGSRVPTSHFAPLCGQV